MSDTQQFELIARREAIADLLRRRVIAWRITAFCVTAGLTLLAVGWVLVLRH